MADHLTLIVGSYYVQMAVPTDVRAVIGRPLFRKSLRTGNRREAERLAGPILVAWRAEIAAARGQRNPALEEAVRLLEGLGYVVAHPSIPSSMERWDTDAEAMVKPSTPPEIADAARFAVEFERAAADRAEASTAARLEAAGLPADTAAVAAKAAAQAHHAPRIEAADKALSTITGTTAPPPPASAGTLELALEVWRGNGRKSPSALSSATGQVRVFTQLHGEIALADITRRHLAEYLAALKEFPVKLPLADRGLPIRDLIAKYNGQPDQRPDIKTVRAKFAMIAAILEVAVNSGMIESNPARTLKVGTNDAKKAKIKTRITFTDEELKKLFADLDGRGDELTWIAKLAMTTGARLNEICQLRAGDVLVDGGVTAINIHVEPDEFGERRIKNAASIRKVPLRAEIGERFLAYAKTKDGLLFPGFQSKNGTSNLASKKVGLWIRRTVKDERKVFHCFRHGFEDACRAAGVPADVRNALTGHVNGDAGEGYGAGFTLNALAEAVEKLRFPIVLTV